MKKNILITGGAGYIGSCLINYLYLDKKFNIICVDNLSNGNKNFLPKNIEFYNNDFSDLKILKKIFSKKIDFIIHLAAFISVEESTKNKNKYMVNNYIKTKKFINFSKKFCKNYIFSSTAAVYKNQKKKVSEVSSLDPNNPYALSKLKCERFLLKQKDLNFFILRYFNVAGSSLKHNVGLVAKKPTHLIKKLCYNIVKKRKSFFIYGYNYNTKDGTAVRDYIHILDLCDIHYQILNIKKIKFREILNCGYGTGYTVLETVKKLLKISKKKINIIFKNKRPGDSESLVASNLKLLKILKWNPKYNNLDLILKSSYEWEKTCDIKKYN